MPSSRAPIRSARSCWCSAPTPAWCTSAPRRSSRASVDDPTRSVRAGAARRRRARRRAVAAGRGGAHRAAVRRHAARSGSRPAAATSSPRSKPWWRTPPPTAASSSRPATCASNAPLRAVCEKAKCAAAIPCYADNERDLARLIDDEMRAARLAIAPDARAALVSLIGGDRQASRNEIRKLALYAHGKDRVELDDVLAVVADASALGARRRDRCGLRGRAAEAEAQFAKARVRRHARRARSVGGAAPGRRSFTRRGSRSTAASRAELAIEKCHSADAFQPQARGRGGAAAWTAPRLERAMAQLAEATLECAPQPRRWRTRSPNAHC